MQHNSENQEVQTDIDELVFGHALGHCFVGFEGYL